MFQVILKSEFARRRHSDAPFLEERTRYLQHCAECGSTIGTLHVKSNELLWTARLLPPDAAAGVDIGDLQEIVRRRMAIHESKTTSYRLIAVARPWLRYLGWWRGPIETVPFRRELDQYVEWMRSERGLTPCTVAQWRFRVLQFLKWRDAAGGQLSDLAPTDIDRYFIEGAVRWCRVSSAYIGCALRAFFRFAGAQGWCSTRLASTIHGPRVYEHESLPKGPSWSDVQRLLAAADTDKPKDIRDRAILMLLSIYGMRRGEVATLRLEDIDWRKRVVRLVRLKRRDPQVCPLLPTMAEALARYIDTARPRCAFREVFIQLQAPRRPISAPGLYDMVRDRFDALGIELPHKGPHALRHACAARMLAEGLTFKEIGDHLGHRSSSATGVYAKVNLAGLREVAAFDLGDLS